VWRNAIRCEEGKAREREGKQTKSSIKRKIKGERRNIFITMFILALLDSSFGSLPGNEKEVSDSRQR